MLTQVRFHLTLLITVWLVALPSWAEPVVIGGDHENQIIEGRGRDFVIEGHHHNVIISGNSGRVQVNGHHQKVVVEAPRVLEVNGHHNNVYFQGNPQLVRGGQKNTITRGDGGVAVSSGAVENGGDEIVISGAAQVETFEGGNRTFVISGAGNTIRITGRAAVIRLTGSANKVDVDEAGLIELTGVDNHAVFRRGNPEIDNTGLNNTATRR